MSETNLKAEKKEFRAVSGIVDKNGSQKHDLVYTMAARLSDGSKTISIGAEEMCFTIEADVIIDMLEKVNGE